MAEATSARARVNPEIEALISRRPSSALKTQETAKDRFADIASNPFYQIAFNESTTPDQKLAELQKVQATIGTKAEMMANMEAFDKFKAFVQDKREQMATELMKLTDTTTYAELQATYNDINRDLDQFNKDMQPLIDIVDAVYKIRTASPNGTVEAYRLIKAAAGEDAERASKLESLKATFELSKSTISKIDQEIASLNTQKGMFGFGGVKPEALAKIAQLEVQKKDVLSSMESTSKQITELESSAATSLGEGSDFDPQALATVRDMLNLSSEQHTERQRKLVQSALNFVSTTKARVGSITNHLQGQDKSLDKINDANQRMTGLYALLNESSTGAKSKILEERTKLATVPENESKIAKMEREDKLRILDEYIERLEITSADTDLTYADLSTGAIRINTMRQANRNQINKAQAMQTRGIAGVADRLVVTLNAVSSAAVNEAQAAAIDTNRSMIDVTNRIAQTEVIKNATGMDEINEDLRRAFDDLESYGAVAEEAGRISRETLSEMQDNLAAMQEAAKAVQDSAREQIAAAAETIVTRKAGEGSLKEKSATQLDAFGLEKKTA